MTIKNALEEISKKISFSEAEILLAFVLDKNREWLWAHDDKDISQTLIRKFQNLVKRRLGGEPIPYIIHNQEFHGLDFFVNKNVLIPRPETEILVEEAIKMIEGDRRDKLIIADVGTGSGCIGVTIATKLKSKKVKIYATDILKKALEIAKKNAQKHNLSNAITFLRGDLLDALPEKVDIVVANLPYVKSDFNFNLFEPKKALDGGKNGLLIIKKLLKQAPKYLKPGGVVFLEISPEQKRGLSDLILKIFPDAKINKFINDYNKKVRVLGLTI